MLHHLIFKKCKPWIYHSHKIANYWKNWQKYCTARVGKKYCKCLAEVLHVFCKVTVNVGQIAEIEGRCKLLCGKQEEKMSLFCFLIKYVWLISIIGVNQKTIFKMQDCQNGRNLKHTVGDIKVIFEAKSITNFRSKIMPIS